MVSIGKPVEELLADPGAEDNKQYSIEFCGGTHLADTSGVHERLSDELLLPARMLSRHLLGHHLTAIGGPAWIGQSRCHSQV